LKRSFLFVVFILAVFTGFSQADSTAPLYLRFPILPSFKLTKVPDSTSFTKQDLKKNKPTIVMIFSPDCEHCQEETKMLTANIGLFKKAQIIMASPTEYRFLRAFYDEYKIAGHSNIIMGRDPGYYFGTFYKVRSFPAIFIYDKKGNLITSFSGETPIKEIADALKLPSPYNL